MTRAQISQLRSLLITSIMLAAFVGLSGPIDRPVPHADVVPPVPSLNALLATSLGDEEFAFRERNLLLQHVGNLGGKIVPFRLMDYHRLIGWLELLDRLDTTSQLNPELAGYLYSATTKSADLDLVTDYLVDRARRDHAHDWRWMAQAIYLQQYKVKNLDRALALANELSAWNEPEIPMWARELRIFLLRAKGDKAGAAALLAQILRTDTNLSSTEKKWIYYYSKKALGVDMTASGG